MAAAPVPAPFTAEWTNGHNGPKSFGDTIYRGPLENLPYTGRTPTHGEAVAAMYEEGYVIFPGVLSSDEVALLRSRVDEMGSRNDADYVVPRWCYNKQITSAFHENPDLLGYIDPPGIFELAEAIHTGSDGPCQLVGGSFWVTGAGRQMGIHVDYQPISLPEEVLARPDVRVPIFISTAHYYLNDMVAELGPTLVVPGSHRAGRAPRDETDWQGVSPKAVMVRAGDVCIFRSDLWHGAWMNSYQEDRRYIMQVLYGNGMLSGRWYPSLEFPERYSPEVLERATPRQRMLMGERG